MLKSALISFAISTLFLVSCSKEEIKSDAIIPTTVTNNWNTWVGTWVNVANGSSNISKVNIEGTNPANLHLNLILNSGIVSSFKAQVNGTTLSINPTYNSAIYVYVKADASFREVEGKQIASFVFRASTNPNATNNWQVVYNSSKAIFQK